jgi:hypothetical protein
LELLLDDFDDSEEVDEDDEPSELDELLAGVALGVLLPSDESFDAESFSFDSLELLGPLADDVDDRESLMYQPLPLNTMPTGWMTLRSVPPHCSQVVSGASV